MAGVEFVPEQPDEELLDAGARKPWPPWLVPVAVVVVVVAGFIVLLARNSSHQPGTVAQSASPTPSESVATLAAPSGVPLPAVAEGHGSFGRPVDPGADVLGIAVSGDTWWEVQPRAILRYNQVGVQAHGALPVALPAVPSQPPFVILDLPTDNLWVIVGTARRTELLEFDSVRLTLRRTVRLQRGVTGAAALDGVLYLTSGHRLIGVTARGGVRRLARLPNSLGAIATDSARGGLVMGDAGFPSDLFRVRPHRSGSVRVTEVARLPVTKATLAVANGAIWLGGFGHQGAVLERLDPTSLRPIARSPLRRQLGPGAILVASGVLDVWVRDGDSGSLHCVDAAQGAALQKWMIGGQVSSGGGTALVATSDGAVPLHLSSCSG